MTASRCGGGDYQASSGTPTCDNGATIAPNAYCRLVVVFQPRSFGSETDSLSASGSNNQAAGALLRGSGS